MHCCGRPSLRKPQSHTQFPSRSPPQPRCTQQQWQGCCTGGLQVRRVLVLPAASAAAFCNGCQCLDMLRLGSAAATVARSENKPTDLTPGRGVEMSCLQSHHGCRRPPRNLGNMLCGKAVAVVPVGVRRGAARTTPLCSRGAMIYNTHTRGYSPDEAGGKRAVAHTVCCSKKPGGPRAWGGLSPKSRSHRSR